MTHTLPVARTAFTVTVLVTTSACGGGLLQTAKVAPPEDVDVAVGLSFARLSKDVERATEQSSALVWDSMARVGVGYSTDVGVSVPLGLGLRVDAKHSLLPATTRFAVAARGGVGYLAAPATGTSMLMGGIVSYDVTPSFVPYAGLALTNHHLTVNSDSSSARPGERPTARTGYGDGVGQAAAGVRIGERKRVHLEVSHYAPLWNDPGDNYRFTATTLFTFAISHL